MDNFYTEIPELRYHLNNPMMERICELKERGYQDKDQYDYAPQDYADAIDSYDKVLEITGEITGQIIAPNAEGVDAEGPHCANGRVEYASGTKQNLDAMVKAGLNGMTMPRRFGGLNFPITPYTMCAEIVAAADAGFNDTYQSDVSLLYPNFPLNPLKQADAADTGFTIFTLRFAEPRDVKTRDEVVNQIVQVAFPTGSAAITTFETVCEALAE